MNKAAQAYQTNAITTATPADLTLMLYQGAIKFVKQSKMALMEKKLDRSSQYNIRVQDILQELMITLNQDIPIAAQMFALYEYMYNRMVEANLKKDTAILDEVEGLFIEFRDTWKEAMVLAKKD
jgi:flagellar protein FliS